MTTSTITAWAAAHALPLAAGAALVALALANSAVRALRKRGATLVDTITVVVALAATVYAATGTLRYLDRVMHYGPDLRLFLVGVLEGAVVVSGLRARRNTTESGSAGVDGVALWVLTVMSGILSATTSRSLSEALGRLAIPAVGAWLWERLLAPERRAHKGKRAPSVIRWRITRERIAVWLRLADAVDTDVSTVDAGRRVARYLKATDRLARPTLFRLLTLAGLRAYRVRMKLVADALRHGDPSQVHEHLSTAAFAEAMTRLGLGTASQGEASESPLITPADSEFAEVVASLPPVPVSEVNGRKVAAASAPARRQASVTARIGVDRDSAAEIYRESVEQGAPLSSRSLARRTGLSQSTAARLIRTESESA